MNLNKKLSFPSWVGSKQAAASLLTFSFITLTCISRAQAGSIGPVDAFIDMEGGDTVGAQITPALMTAGTIGFTGGTWSALNPSDTTTNTPQGMTVGTSHNSLLGSVTVGGTTYPVSHASQSIAYNDNDNFSAVVAHPPAGHTAVTTSGYITLPPPAQTGNATDLVRVDLDSGHFCVMQADNSIFRSSGNTYGLHLHSDGNGVIISNNLTVTGGATYWYSMKCDYGAGLGSLNFYDTSGNLFGSLTIQLFAGKGNIIDIYYGNEETGTAPGSTTFFEDSLIDYTHAAFPLGPGGTSVPPPGISCDLNSDGSVNVLDVQRCVNQALGVASCTNGDVNGDGSCNVLDVQKVVNGALGGTCP